MYFRDNTCVKEIHGNLEVCGSTLIEGNLEVEGTSFFKESRSRNTFTENNSSIGGDLDVKKKIKSDSLEINNVKVNQNIEVNGIGLMQNLAVYETTETNILNNLQEMNVLNDINIYGLTNTNDILNDQNMYTRLNSLRGSLFDLGENPFNLLNLSKKPSINSMSKINENKEKKEINSNSVLNLIPDIAKNHPKFEKIIPIFDINQNTNSNEPMLMKASAAPLNPFGLWDFGFQNQLTFDINNSVYIGIGPALQILPFITLFPSYFLTDINVNNNASIDGDIYNYGNTNVSNNIYLGGDIIYTNEDNKSLSEKLNSVNNKLKYLANKIGLSPEELNEFLNL